MLGKRRVIQSVGWQNPSEIGTDTGTADGLRNVNRVRGLSDHESSTYSDSADELETVEVTIRHLI